MSLSDVPVRAGGSVTPLARAHKKGLTGPTGASGMTGIWPEPHSCKSPSCRRSTRCTSDLDWTTSDGQIICGDCHPRPGLCSPNGGSA